MIWVVCTSCLLAASLGELKISAQKHIQIDHFKQSDSLVESLNSYEDPEAIYLSIALLAGRGDHEEALKKFEKQKSKLEKTPFYSKSLESIALAVFTRHFVSPQEPVRLASLAAISLESDVRVLNFLTDALNYPSLRVKMLALSGLSKFPDERVKKALIKELSKNPHPAIAQKIAELFATWKDKRIIPLLYEKIADDISTLNEKIGFVAALRELETDVTLTRLKQLAQSPHAAERLMASYLISKQSVLPEHKDILDKLLKDPLIWVKQSTLLSLIKLKIRDPRFDDEIIKWAGSSCFELEKAYYLWGLITDKDQIEDEFLNRFTKATSFEKRALASVLYGAGPNLDPFVEKVLDLTEDPCIHLELGLYMLSGEKTARSLEVIQNALQDLETKRLSIKGEPVLPLFEIQDEMSLDYQMSIGSQTRMDKNIRLQIFHLLATKKMPEAKEVLKKLLKTDLFEVSIEAMVHFWENFGFEEKEYFEALLKDYDPEIRFRAALVLNFLGPNVEAKKMLMESFSKQSYPMKIQILFSLCERNEPDVHQFYLKQIHSPYPMIQAVAAGCLFTCLYN